MPTCAKCGSQDEGGFYRSNLTRCKECVKAQVRSNREANADYYRAYDRARYREHDHRKEAARACANSAAGLRSKRKANARMKAEEPQKYRARNAVSNALRDGKLKKGECCFFCSAQGNLQAHHHDYAHPLDVQWLCPSCHGKLHAINGDFLRTKRRA